MDSEMAARDVQDEEEDPMKLLREGIILTIKSWWRIRWEGMLRSDVEPELGVDSLCYRLFDCFIHSKHDEPSATIKFQLKQQLTSFIGNPVDDNSTSEVCDQLVSMYQECLQNDFRSIQILKEADARRKRHNKFQMESLPYIQKFKETDRNLEHRVKQAQLKRLIQSPSSKDKFKKSIILRNSLGIEPPISLETFEEEVSQFGFETYLKKNFGIGIELETPFPSVEEEIVVQQPNIICLKASSSSEMDDSHLTNSMKVFKEGIGLLIEDLWARNDVFIHEDCGSNPSLMLQQLVDEILFWFTQTIKPVSFDCIEWILRNELYSHPVVADKVIAITQEVSKKLMVMYEECLQDNFSSVETLREESLSQGLLARM